ncbi:MAG: LysE family transporter [Phycisphaerales bacterium]|nr:LysE family transporter [Phycisphaerales bacterium]
MWFLETINAIDYTGLLFYTFVICVTPGPNNFFLLQAGRSKKFPFLIKIVPGFFIGNFLMCMVAATGVAIIFIHNHALFLGLKVGASLILLYLAFLFTKVRFDEEHPSKAVINNSLGAFLFQIVNPKTWICCITGAVGFTHPAQHPLLVATIFSAIVSTIAIPCLILWFGAGAFIKRTVKKRPHLNIIISYILFVLLLLAVVAIWIE